MQIQSEAICSQVANRTQDYLVLSEMLLEMVDKFVLKKIVLLCAIADEGLFNNLTTSLV